MNTTLLQQTKRPAARKDKQVVPPAPETNPPGTGAPRSLRLERILVPLDFSEPATEALRFALPFARETGARLDLLHVIAPLSLPADTGYLPNEWNEWEAQQSGSAAARLKQLAAAEIRRPTRANFLVRKGQPAPVIARVAQEQRSDLVVVSTHGHSGLKRFFLGSTAEAVVRQSPCPVLTVRRRVLARRGTPQSPPSERINRVLVPVDFSAPSREMLQYAADFARQFRASLLLLHVVQQINVPSRVAYYATGLQLAVLHEGMKQLAEWAERFVPAGVEAGQSVLAGTPYDVIVQTAHREQVDLIIIATQGLTGLKRLFPGSTAGRVVRHAPCPVLVVRKHEHDFVAESPPKEIESKQ
ncbi:MAG: universal stress protein [Verrucomicrobia bacterium]|nr:universal stress protein [Verrucomicrobiota bacterium]